MNTIVNQLLDVDKNARRLLDEAQEYHDRTLRETQEEKQKLLEEFRLRGEVHLRELHEEQAGEIAEVEQAVSRKQAEALAALETQYAANHAQWEDELLRRTLQAVKE